MSAPIHVHRGCLGPHLAIESDASTAFRIKQIHDRIEDLTQRKNVLSNIDETLNLLKSLRLTIDNQLHTDRTKLSPSTRLKRKPQDRSVDTITNPSISTPFGTHRDVISNIETEERRKIDTVVSYMQNRISPQRTRQLSARGERSVSRSGTVSLGQLHEEASSSKAVAEHVPVSEFVTALKESPWKPSDDEIQAVLRDLSWNTKTTVPLAELNQVLEQRSENEMPVITQVLRNITVSKKNRESFPVEQTRNDWYENRMLKRDIRSNGFSTNKNSESDPGTFRWFTDSDLAEVQLAATPRGGVRRAAQSTVPGARPSMLTPRPDGTGSSGVRRGTPSGGPASPVSRVLRLRADAPRPASAPRLMDDVYRNRYPRDVDDFSSFDDGQYGVSRRMSVSPIRTGKRVVALPPNNGDIISFRAPGTVRPRTRTEREMILGVSGVLDAHVYDF